MWRAFQALPDLSALLEFSRTTAGRTGLIIFTIFMIAFMTARTGEKTTGEVIAEWGMNLWSLGVRLYHGFAYEIGIGLRLIGREAARLRRWLAENTEVNITIAITPKSLAAFSSFLGWSELLKFRV